LKWWPPFEDFESHVSLNTKNNKIDTWLLFLFYDSFSYTNLSFLNLIIKTLTKYALNITHIKISKLSLYLHWDSTYTTQDFSKYISRINLTESQRRDIEHMLNICRKIGWLPVSWQLGRMELLRLSQEEKELGQCSFTSEAIINVSSTWKSSPLFVLIYGWTN
jgi:hypothetical protein